MPRWLLQIIAMVQSAQPRSETDRIRALEGSLAATTERLRDAELSLERVRKAYQNAIEQLHLLRHRIFVASAERRQDDGAQLAFDSMFEQVRKPPSKWTPPPRRRPTTAECGGETGNKPKPKRKRGRQPGSDRWSASS
jgi:hypothetical protein